MSIFVLAVRWLQEPLMTRCCGGEIAALAGAKNRKRNDAGNRKQE